MPDDSHVSPNVSSIEPVVPPALKEAVPENLVQLTFSLTPLPEPSVVSTAAPTPSMVLVPLGVGFRCSDSRAAAIDGSARSAALTAASASTMVFFFMFTFLLAPEIVPLEQSRGHVRAGDRASLNRPSPVRLQR